MRRWMLFPMLAAVSLVLAGCAGSSTPSAPAVPAKPSKPAEPEKPMMKAPSKPAEPSRQVETPKPVEAARPATPIDPTPIKADLSKIKFTSEATELFGYDDGEARAFFFTNGAGELTQ